MSDLVRKVFASGDKCLVCLYTQEQWNFICERDLHRFLLDTYYLESVRNFSDVLNVLKNSFSEFPFDSLAV